MKCDLSTIPRPLRTLHVFKSFQISFFAQLISWPSLLQMGCQFHRQSLQRIIYRPNASVDTKRRALLFDGWVVCYIQTFVAVARQLTPCSEKMCHSTLAFNFVKCWSIFSVVCLWEPPSRYYYKEDTRRYTGGCTADCRKECLQGPVIPFGKLKSSCKVAQLEMLDK